MSIVNKRLFISIFVICTIAIVFWSESRIPALNEKAQMGLRTNFGDLAFEILLPVTEQQSSVERIARTSVNWAYTNMQGMFFGLLFAAAALTLMSTLRARSFKRPWQNTALGVLVGTPLGVCVNCATPIALSIYSAGARLETTLASLASSPTLNIIVLTMSFTLLPIEMAIAKLAGVLLFLFLIPVVIRLSINANGALKSVDKIPLSNLKRPASCALPDSSINNETIWQAVIGTCKGYIANLLYITKLAVPLMLLAGIMGAIVIELVPFSFLEEVDIGFAGIFLAAITATLLPVPIAFDVIMVMALLAGGVDKGVAMALLFGLGIYSIYPASIIARYISVKLSLFIFVVVTLIALLLGVWAQHYFQAVAEQEGTRITEGLTRSTTDLAAEAINICASLPTHLQSICFRQHLDNLDDFVEADKLCMVSTNLFDRQSCESIVDSYVIRQKALATSDPSFCERIADSRDMAACSIDVIQHIAVKEHDINACNRYRLGPKAATACRNNFLNENLLFNPDGSACKNLSGNELDTCRINSEIYLYTDAVNIKGCESISIASAREHCRYTVASVMIGRYGDVSGCNVIEDTQLQQRCREQPLSWQIVKAGKSEKCSEITDPYFQDICVLRIAHDQISKILYKNTATDRLAALKLTRPKQAETVGSRTTVSTAPALNESMLMQRDDLEISRMIYPVANNPIGQFEKYAASSLGVIEGWQFSMPDFFEPFIIGKGIASGDFNKDVWPDIALATERGVRLYQNTGGSFEPVPLNQHSLQNENLFLVAMVDIDNDGNQDLFASAYGGKNFILKNLDGHFADTELVELPGQNRLTMAAGFGDLTRNGKLDIVLGNWSSGVEKLFAPEQSQNIVLYNESAGFRTEKLQNAKGETNSVLLTDINNDNKTDILVGNDRMVPDYYMLNMENNAFSPITNDMNMVDTTSMFTMSIDTADFNNDLLFDIFSTDMTFARTSHKEYCAVLDDKDELAECEKWLRAYEKFNNNDLTYCESKTDSLQKADCYTAFAIQSAKTLKDPAICDYLPEQDAARLSLCVYLATDSTASESIDHTRHLPQNQHNVLLMNKQGVFRDVATEMGVSSSYWSWNAKAADLDNDGWQDLYVGNGFHFGDSFFEIQENIAFHNQAGEGFIEKQKLWAIDDRLNTPSYTYTDINLDGRMDIIATGVLSEPRIYINRINSFNSITFLLENKQGNHSGIGAKIVIEYGGEEHQQQIKEMKLSSGFMSFDNPVLHFGTGEHTRVDKVMLIWPDGTRHEINEPLPTNSIYRIKRLK